jgi:hypothetical protein
LRYDPEASPTKNLTASKYDQTADKIASSINEPVKENESRRLTYNQRPDEG